jgi:hypothetical protein
MPAVSGLDTVYSMVMPQAAATLFVPVMQMMLPIAKAKTVMYRTNITV